MASRLGRLELKTTGGVNYTSQHVRTTKRWSLPVSRRSASS